MIAMKDIPVPVHMTLEPLGRDDDKRRHELCVGVFGVDRPARVGIESEAYHSPHVLCVFHDGGIGLPRRVFNDLMVACFRLLVSTLEDDGSAAEWTIPDLTPFIERRFPPSDAAMIFDALRPQVTSGLKVKAYCCVRVD